MEKPLGNKTGTLEAKIWEAHDNLQIGELMHFAGQQAKEINPNLTPKEIHDYGRVTANAYIFIDAFERTKETKFFDSAESNLNKMFFIITKNASLSKKLAKARIGWWQAYRERDKDRLLSWLEEETRLWLGENADAVSVNAILCAYFKAMEHHNSRNYDKAGEELDKVESLKLQNYIPQTIIS